MMMKKRSMFLFILLLLGACNTSTESNSYQGIIRIHDTNYYFNDAENYTQSVKIGEIKEQTPPDVVPVRHLRSNTEAKGSEIYSTVESSNHIIVKNKVTDEISVYTSQEKRLTSK